MMNERIRDSKHIFSGWIIKTGEEKTANKWEGWI